MFLSFSILLFSIYELLTTFVNCQFEEAEFIFRSDSSALMKEKFNPFKEFTMSVTNNRLVIDLKSRMFIKRVVIITEDNKLRANVTADCMDELYFYRMTCLKGESHNFVCNKLCRIISIEDIVGTFKVQLEGYQSYLDMNLGCHKYNGPVVPTDVGHIDDCRSECITGSYFGMKEHKCICLDSFRQLESKDLILCPHICEGTVMVRCGSRYHYSMYYTGISSIWQMHLSQPMCLYNSTNCPECPRWRYGHSCELLDCTFEEACDYMICTYDHIILNYKNAICLCEVGYYTEYFVNPICQDIDECENTQVCDMKTTTCVNTYGSYKCHCNPGYTKNVSRFSCRDYDECLDQPCDVDSTICINLIGLFSCKCLTGFKPSNMTFCHDIDECDKPILNECHNESTNCINNVGSYSCPCKPGFVFETWKTCKDVNECEMLIHDCIKTSECTNTIGSFKCHCPNGTIKTNQSYTTECKDIDECKIQNSCNTSNSFCLNIFNGYMCSCFSGYLNLDNYQCKIVESNNFTITTLLNDGEYLITTESAALERYIYQMLIIAGSSLFIFIACTGLIIFASKKLYDSASLTKSKTSSTSSRTIQGRSVITANV